MRIKLSKLVSATAVCSLLFTSVTMAQYNPNRIMPADSRGFDAVASKLVIPVPDLSPYVQKTDPGPSGSYCGRVAIYNDNGNVTERVPCQGHQVYGPVSTTLFHAATDAYCVPGGENSSEPTCYDATPAYYYTATVNQADCPAGYSYAITGAAGPYGYYSCIKS